MDYINNLTANIKKSDLYTILISSTWNFFEWWTICFKTEFSAGKLEGNSGLFIRNHILLAEGNLLNSEICFKFKLKDKNFFGIDFEISDASVWFIIGNNLNVISDIALEDLVWCWSKWKLDELISEDIQGLSCCSISFSDQLLNFFLLG